MAVIIVLALVQCVLLVNHVVFEHDLKTRDELNACECLCLTDSPAYGRTSLIHC
jgi:hypothetical protein